MSKTTNKFSPEMREGAVRLVLDNEGQHGSRWNAVLSISAKIGCAPQTLNDWVKKAEVDSGKRPGVSREMAERMKALERENRELAPGERDPSEGISVFCDGGVRPPVEVTVKFIGDHRGEHGVEPICDMLPIAPATYYDHLAKRADPARLSVRAKRDEALRPEIQRVFDANWEVYGARKVWRQLRREGFVVARCTVARLMKAMGIQGIIRGKPQKTTIPDKKLPCPLDKVNRQFRAPAPNRLWVSDFTYVATWKGFVYVAFIIDAYARKIVGWHVSTSPHAGFVLDALEQAVHERCPIKGMGLHPSYGSWQPRRIQPVVATHPIIFCLSSWSRASAGVRQPRVLRGLVFKACATALNSLAPC
jgi:transposase-like protein